MTIRKISINKIIKCPICKEKRSVGCVRSYLANKVRKMYFYTTCMVEFNSNGTLYPPIKEDPSSGNLKRSIG